MTVKNNIRKCDDSWWWQSDENWIESSKLFTIESKGKLDGITPHTVGIIVTVNEPRDITYFDAGIGKGVFISSGTEKRIFDHIYGSGKHTLCISCRSNPKGNERFWQSKLFDIDVKTKEEAKKEDPDCVITNFFQGSGGGQYVAGATGLDVDFSISWEENPKTIMWQFSDNEKEERRKTDTLMWPKATTLKSVSHTYKELGSHRGFVEVMSNKGYKCRRDFTVVMTNLSKFAKS